MNRAEAAAALGVDEGAPLGEIRKRYETLHNDYQIRLTNAPTPALKKTYQQKLQEILDACDALVPGFAAGQHGGGDLPSAEPVLSERQDRRPSPSAPRPSPKPLGRTTADVAADAGLPRTTIIAGVVAVVMATAFTFAALRWYGASARAADLEAERTKAVATAAALEAR